MHPGYDPRPEAMRNAAFGGLRLTRSRSQPRETGMGVQTAQAQDDAQGKTRVILLGPRAQQIIGPYLLEVEPDEYLFSPKRSERLRRIDQRRRRKTRVQRSQQGDARRRRSPKRKAGEKYTTTSYRRAIHRACGRPESRRGDRTGCGTAWQPQSGRRPISKPSQRSSVIRP